MRFVSSSGFSCILSVMLHGFTGRKKGHQKNKLPDSITVTCAKKVLQWHLSMLYLVHWYSLNNHIQTLEKNTLLLPCQQSGICSKGSSQEFLSLGFNLYHRVKEVKTEVEMSGQTVWDCWAEGMKKMLGKRCLTGIKVKIIYEQHQHFFFQIKLAD